MKAIISLLLSLVWMLELANAQLFSSKMVGGGRAAAEYWAGKEEGKPLITIHLVNGVGSPGVYHIPIDTNLGELLAYAGGALPDAELDKIAIRRTVSKDQFEFILYDLKKLQQSLSPLPKLADNDVITIPVSYTLNKTAQIVGLTSGILAIILTAITISDRTAR